MGRYHLPMYAITGKDKANMQIAANQTKCLNVDSTELCYSLEHAPSSTDAGKQPNPWKNGFRLLRLQTNYKDERLFFSSRLPPCLCLSIIDEDDDDDDG